MNIITGYTGAAHITSAQDRDINQGSYGTGSYILDVGRMLEAEVVSVNEIRIRDGALSHQGCVGSIPKGAYDALAISNGSQGMQRHDLIVCRYAKDAETNVESLSLVVIEGTAAATATDPSYNTGNIQSGDSPVDMPLYRVVLDGITITSVDQIAENVRTQKELDEIVTAAAITSYTPTWATGHAPADYHCVVSAGICFFSYRGPTVAHSTNTQLGTLPVGARPTSQVFCPFVKMSGGAVGCIHIFTTGAFEVMLITDTSSTGRLYFNCSFPVV